MIRSGTLRFGTFHVKTLRSRTLRAKTFHAKTFHAKTLRSKTLRSGALRARTLPGRLDSPSAFFGIFRRLFFSVSADNPLKFFVGDDDFWRKTYFGDRFGNGV